MHTPAKPRYCTPLTDRPNLLTRFEAIAAGLGRRPIPWQRTLAAGSTEIDRDTGTFYYDTVVVTVPRQAGKTITDQALAIQNAMLGPGRRIWYTAQDGTHARDKFREIEDDLENSPIGRRGLGIVAKYLRGNGSELIRFINDSEYRPFAPTEESLHSKQADRVSIDEAWAFTAAQGRALTQAIAPTQTTRRRVTGHRPQTWIFSTEGTLESTWLNTILDDLRDDPTAQPRTFFIDYGIAEDTDPDDLEQVALAHPGYGHLFDMSDLIGFRAKFGDDVNGFARAYGNRRTGAESRIIPAEAWRDAATLQPIPQTSPIALSAAVGVDGVDTAIVATGLDAQIGTICEVIEVQPGTSHALARLIELQQTHHAPIAIDARGPSAALRDQAARAGLTLIDINLTAVTASCQTLMTGLDTGTWHYRPDPDLDRAASLAARRWVADGGWIWGRRASIGSIAALEAATLGIWAIDHLPTDPGMQLW